MSVSDMIGSVATSAAEHAIAFGQDRHKTIANNVANIDTPGYRMRDLDVASFRAALGRAIEQSRRPGPSMGSLELTPPDRIGPEGSSRSPDARRLRGIVFHDDNDRSVEKLAVAMTKNLARTRNAVDLLRKQIQLLRSVISENVA